MPFVKSDGPNQQTIRVGLSSSKAWAALLWQNTAAVWPSGVNVVSRSRCYHSTDIDLSLVCAWAKSTTPRNMFRPKHHRTMSRPEQPRQMFLFSRGSWYFARGRDLATAKIKNRNSLRSNKTFQNLSVFFPTKTSNKHTNLPKPHQNSMETTNFLTLCLRNMPPSHLETAV